MNKVIYITYQPPTSGIHSVGVAADFTNWKIIPLTHSKGLYKKKFILTPGVYQYKLIIDGMWITDPSNPCKTPDPYGGFNSVITINDVENNIQDISSLFNKILDNDTTDFPVPEWVIHGIIYQIFPDRFYNGNPSLNPNFTEWYYQDSITPPTRGKYLKPNQEYYHFVDNWYDISGLQQNPYLPKGKPDWWSFYGGDIPGVKQKLDYLLDLGITIIYFNPLCKAKSNHKYDAADFKSIDPHFGSEDDFKQLVKECHQKGIRIIVDIALNHTGETFWAFRDCIEKGPQSPYWTWYDWIKWPLPQPLPPDFNPKEYYQCWWGIKDMPDLNFDLSRNSEEENAVTEISEAIPNQPLVDYLLEVVNWWLVDMDIDGFRLDVPNEVPFWFWKLFRQKVKSLKPDAWLVGEIWQNPYIWVSDDYFDSVMNYAHFKDPVLDFFIYHNVSLLHFIKRVSESLIYYPRSSQKIMMNILGSHDTWRIAEIAKGKIEKLRLAVLFQMTWIGTPHIYYGDEIAMLGKGDPDNRRPFNWRWENDQLAKETHTYYKNLISIRKQYSVLQSGTVRFLYHSQLLIFERVDVEHTALIIINNTRYKLSYDIYDKEMFLLVSVNQAYVNSKGILIFPAYSGIVLYK